MKKLLIALIVFGLVFGIGSSVYAEDLGLGYGFFEPKEGDGEIEGLILSTDTDFGDSYNLTSRYFMGKGEGDYENNLLDLKLYKRISSQDNTNFYLGGGWKWLTEDFTLGEYEAVSSQWGFPLSAKLEIESSGGFTLGTKADYWFFGSYEIDTNTTAEAEGDFSGYGFDVYAEKELAENISFKAGYLNEDYTFGEDENADIDEFDNGFSGFYFSGSYNY